MFKFKNFGPFKEEVEFDMRAIKSYKEHPYNLIDYDFGDPLLKIASIYGANASGKSHFVDAYSAFRKIVNNSFYQNEKDMYNTIIEQNYKPYEFDDVSKTANSEFEAIFYHGSFEYTYGFIYNKKNIEYEWFYKKSLVTNRTTTILERTPNKISLGSSIQKNCNKYIDDIDSDVLALSFFTSLKLRTSVFREILYCINSILPVSFSCNIQSESMLDLYFERDFNKNEKENLLSFLGAIDVGIKDISVRKSKLGISVFTFHIGKDNKKYPLKLEQESDGTKRAIAIYSIIRIAALQGKGVIIDEFNNQLHPLLQKYILDLFYNESLLGQIIYTTHDTTLLDKQFMRRDQIWFAEKNEYGESSLFSLAEFKIRNDVSFRKDYLGGVFGGIPNLKEYAFKENNDGN